MLTMLAIGVVAIVFLAFCFGMYELIIETRLDAAWTKKHDEALLMRKHLNEINR